jgi:GNAT superfamily N-acetyltransferase
MTTATLEDLADQNLAQVARIHHRWQPAARLLDEAGLLCQVGTVPIPAPFQNCMIRTDAALPADQALARAQAFFGSASNPFAVLTSSRRDLDLEQALERDGFTRQANLPSMLAEQALMAPTIDSAWRLMVADTIQDIAAFAHISAQAYESLGLPAFLTPSYFVDQQRMLEPDVSIVLAMGQDGQAIAATMALHTGEVAGLYWVGTLPQARGAGLAAACTAMATNLALARGARAVTLQASHMGEAIYRQLGYREYARTTRWSK